MWTKEEQALHINALELLGTKLGLLSFFKDKKDIKHIRVMMANKQETHQGYDGQQTRVAYINNIGVIRSDLCEDIGVISG